MTWLLLFFENLMCPLFLPPFIEMTLVSSKIYYCLDEILLNSLKL